MVVKTFMDMDQDSEEEKELYLNLALHLASDFFLKHPDKDDIFMFITRQLKGLEDTKSAQFNRYFYLLETSVSDLSEHVFDLILELYNIDSHLLLSVLPQLEFKLKEKGDVVICEFNDIHVPIRLECVKFASHCLMNHPDLAKDLTEFLKVRSHDPEEAIRHDVIVSIVTAAKKDLALVNDALLNFVKERTLDKRWRVRKEAMMGLASIYRKYSLQGEGGREVSKQISWIKDKLLHIYYQNSIDDRLLVERIFAQYMVPHNLETTERMKCLYYLYATLDPNALKALNEMWKCQNTLRHNVKDLLDLVKQPKSEASSKAVFAKVMVITRNLPDPGKAQDFVKKLAQVLEDDERIRDQLETLVSPTCSCKQAEVCVRDITKKIGSPKQPSNPFLEMVKFLLERIAPVHIDTESISHCLMNHPDLAKDLTEFLKVRSHDPEEAIRHDVIVSIVTAAKKDLALVNDALLNFVKERTLDKRWRVRKEAMMGLASIYRKYSLQGEGGREVSKQISWIKDKLLHIYYQNSIDDRLLVERIFAQYMVPHNLETTERMKCLYYLYATLDPNALKALNEMWKCQNTLRHNVKDLLDLVKQPKSEASSKAVFFAKNPGKAQDFVKKLAQVLEDDERIRDQLETLVSPTCSCQTGGSLCGEVL
ncbi:hypothetical protein CRUP_003410 [Coryphaenoides rupestris]|nr:hypothetical protein CRUP_003410 [Coryphaenoides rupestris]